MNELRSLADQLRSQISAPDIPDPELLPKRKSKPTTAQSQKPEPHRSKTSTKVLDEIIAYDNSNHKSMVHVRFDAPTAQLLNHFKMATNVDVTKLVAFSVQSLFKNHPELKSVIKQFIQNLEL